MLTFLYQLIIMPLELMIEVIFTVMYRILNNEGFAIIGVSIVVSFLILPLYRRADLMQEEERDRQDAMKHWVDHIKHTFKGDEQYMLLTTYYRQMNYHPLYALKSSISLLLQIPFFIAAYHYLSNLQVLQDVSFGPIANLGAADAMLQIGGVTVNVLPILMTVVNLLSGAIYSRGFPMKTKVQQYVLTLLFLVLLYNRPAGLVLYWTMNNVFSLGKNIFMKVLKHPMRDFAVCSSVCGIVFLALTVGRVHGIKGIIVVLIAIALQIPLLVLIFRKYFPRAAGKAARETQKIPASLFFLGGVVLTLLAGLLIPLSVISDSPTEFIRVEAYVSPMKYVLMNTAVAAGFFILWFGIFYMLAPWKTRNLFALGYWIISVCSLINYMFFSKNFGSLSTDLIFDNTVKFGRKDMAINALAMLVAAAVLWLVWRYRRSLIRSLYVILILGITALSVRSVVIMNREIAQIPDLVPASEAVEPEAYEPIFRLSKTGKNVVVLMMDKMVSAYLPFIMNEKPELKEKFDGFVWYPNTLSYGLHTNYGTPALFGGYEYTPTKMNERSDMLLGDKQNELLKVMPVLFSQNGFEVTVCDPPYAGYQWVPDLSIFDDYPEIKTYNPCAAGMYTRELHAEFGEYYEQLQKRNFSFYSLFRMVPTVLQKAVYDNGRYLSASRNNTVRESFIKSYGALCHLSDMTEVTDEDQDTFLMMANKTTHDRTLLQMPDYEPALSINNKPYMDPSLYTVDGVTMKMNKTSQVKHYCMNMAAFLKLGDWFDYLRENGVYDNTRIIIVADHGARYVKQFDNLKFDLVDVAGFNPMLLVKDFGATGFSTDHSFMTNGDTPTLATKDVIENPVNPFTGNAINSDAKNEGPQVVTTSRNWKVGRNNGTVYDASDGIWLSVHDDIFVEDNWELVAEGSEVLTGIPE